MKRISCFVLILLLIGIDSNSGQSLPDYIETDKQIGKQSDNQRKLDSSFIHIDSIMYYQKEMQRELRNEMYMAEMPDKK